MSLCDNAEAMAKKHSPAREQDRASGHSAGHGHGQGAGQVAGHTDSATHQVPVHVGIEPGRGSPAGVQDDFQRLVDRLRAGRVVLCAGSSLGRDKAPGRLTFTGVLVRLLEEVARQGGDAAEVAAVRGLVDAQPLAVAGFIRRQLGEGFAAALAAAVKPADGELPEALTLCGQLPLRSVVTTLLDGALNQAVSQAAGAGGTPVRSFTALAAAQAREAQQDGRSRYVLQLLGDATTGEGLVFSESELQRTLSDESLHQLLHDLYSKRSFLFVGFDPREPELQLLLTRALSGIRGVEPSQHFAVLPGLPRGLQKELGAAHGLTVLDGDELTVLRALREAIGDQVGEALPDDEDLEGWLRVLQHEPSRLNKIGIAAGLVAMLAAKLDHDPPNAYTEFVYSLQVASTVNLHDMLTPHVVPWPADFVEWANVKMATYAGVDVLINRDTRTSMVSVRSVDDGNRLREALAAEVWREHGPHVQMVAVVDEASGGSTYFASMKLDALPSEKASEVWARVAPFVAAAVIAYAGLLSTWLLVAVRTARGSLRGNLLQPPPSAGPVRAALAAEGVVFDAAYCNSPLCAPARAVLMTGLQTRDNGMYENVDTPWVKSLSPEIPTIGHMLRKAGYYTAYKGKWHLSREFDVKDPTSFLNKEMEQYGFSDRKSVV